MSLIRTGLVIGAVIYAMPTDTKRQTELIHSASDTLVWGLTYCEREPTTCEQAKVAWGEMVQKAKFGAALAGDLASKWSERNGSGQTQAARPLSIDDLAGQTLAEPAQAAIDPTEAWDPSVNG